MFDQAVKVSGRFGCLQGTLQAARASQAPGRVRATTRVGTLLPWTPAGMTSRSQHLIVREAAGSEWQLQFCHDLYNRLVTDSTVTDPRACDAQLHQEWLQRGCGHSHARLRSSWQPASVLLCLGSRSVRCRGVHEVRRRRVETLLSVNRSERF